MPLHPIFRKISTLLRGFGEISAKFSNFANLGRNFVKMPRNFGEIYPCLSLAEKNRLSFAKLHTKRGEFSDEISAKLAKFWKFIEIFAKFWPFFSEITKEFSPLSRRNKGQRRIPCLWCWLRPWCRPSLVRCYLPLVRCELRRAASSAVGLVEFD